MSSAAMISFVGSLAVGKLEMGNINNALCSNCPIRSSADVNGARSHMTGAFC